jgi:hypothetical protein
LTIIGIINIWMMSSGWMSHICRVSKIRLFLALKYRFCGSIVTVLREEPSNEHSSNTLL